MINDAVKTLLKYLPGRIPEGYWKDGKGFVIKLKPTVDDDEYIEELLFYVEGDEFDVTNPMEHPVILDKEMIKL